MIGSSTCSAARLDSCAGLLFSAKLMLFHCALLAVKVLVVLSLLLKLEPNNRNNAQLCGLYSGSCCFAFYLLGFRYPWRHHGRPCPHDLAWHMKSQAVL